MRWDERGEEGGEGSGGRRGGKEREEEGKRTGRRRQGREGSGRKKRMLEEDSYVTEQTYIRTSLVWPRYTDTCFHWQVMEAGTPYQTAQ